MGKIEIKLKPGERSKEIPVLFETRFFNQVHN